MSNKYRRGFKSEANCIARDVRDLLRIGHAARLDPLQLAKKLGITILPLSKLRAAVPEAVDYFMAEDPWAMSAVTVFKGWKRMIVHNDGHDIERCTSNLAHELGHGLLLHHPHSALDHRGCRDWKQSMEDEASWLGPAILISEEAALHIVEEGMSVAEASREYRVTEQVVTMRLNVTGARRRVQRRRARAVGM